jgi:hypothetical protein
MRARTASDPSMSVTLDALSLISKQLSELTEKVDALSEKMPPSLSRKRKERTDSVDTTQIQICSGKTAKGDPCNHRAVEGKEHCKMHDPERKKRSPKSSTATSTKSLVKIEPVHTHEPTEKPLETCELCETHGDPLNGQIEEDVWSADYEIEPELNERLRALLEEHDL